MYAAVPDPSAGGEGSATPEYSLCARPRPDDDGCNHELPRLSRPPFKNNVSSNPEALNVRYEHLLCFQILGNYNH